MIQDAYLAAGCFWGVEDKLSNLNGVLETSVGYTGGTLEDPTYRLVCGGDTGHAETVHVVFDDDVVTFKDLLRYFFEIHDPTQLNRQGFDIGDNYRSAIFYVNDTQKLEAQELLNEIGPDYNNMVVTNLEEFNEFFMAEEYHQKYLAKKRHV
jgi:methionine-S-sulfoxide reductase